MGWVSSLGLVLCLSWNVSLTASSSADFSPDGTIVARSDFDSIQQLSVKAHERAEELLQDVPGFWNEQRAKIALVLEELLTNVTRHAHRGHPEKTLTLRLWRQGQWLRVSVADQGGNFFNPFDEKDARNLLRLKGDEDDAAAEVVRKKREQVNHDPTRPDGQGGRGIVLIQGFADMVMYQPNADGKNVVGTIAKAGWLLPESAPTSCSTEVHSARRVYSIWELWSMIK